jgi:RNA-directed DNA polymerase
VTEFLKERGLEINQEKTQIVHVQRGFDFFGFHVQRFEGKCLVKPQKSKTLSKLREIKEWLKDNKTVPAGKIIKHLNPIIRG